MSTLLTTPASVAWTQATLLSWSTASRRPKGRLARLLARRRPMRVAPVYRAGLLGTVDPATLACANDNAPR